MIYLIARIERNLENGRESEYFPASRISSFRNFRTNEPTLDHNLISLIIGFSNFLSKSVQIKDTTHVILFSTLNLPCGTSVEDDVVWIQLECRILDNHKACILSACAVAAINAISSFRLNKLY